MGCHPVSSRLITIRLRAVPFNITIVQEYTPMSDYDDNKIAEFCDQLQNVIDQTPKDILVVQGDWNAKVCKDACGNWQGICGPFCHDDTNERGFRLLEFATFNNHVLVNWSFGHHKACRRWTLHSPNGQHHNQIDLILVRNASSQGWMVPEHEVFQEQTLEVTMTCWWWLSTFTWKESASQNTQDSSLTLQSWKIPTCWKPSIIDRQEVCTSHHHVQWR